MPVDGYCGMQFGGNSVVTSACDPEQSLVLTQIPVIQGEGMKGSERTS